MREGAASWYTMTEVTPPRSGPLSRQAINWFGRVLLGESGNTLEMYCLYIEVRNNQKSKKAPLEGSLGVNPKPN